MPHALMPQARSPHALLLIAPEPAATQVADALRSSLDAAIDVASNRRAGLAQLRRNDYALVLFEETLAAGDAESAESIYQNAGAAPVLEMNFAITGATRIVRQVRSALTRRAHDRAQARASATSTLQQELGASLTGLLLESQLALREATPQQAPKLRHMVELAGDLRDRLRR
jgi:hypothetical protein